MVVVEHVVGVVGAGAVAGIWNWSRGGKGVPWRREGTVFLCMLPRVPVQQVSYTLARERAYFLQNGVGRGRKRTHFCLSGCKKATDRFGVFYVVRLTYNWL